LAFHASKPSQKNRDSLFVTLEIDETCSGVDSLPKIMKKFTAIVHRGEPHEGGFWATCLEVPGANGQGKTRRECLNNLAAAVRDLLELNREEAMANDPEAEQTELLLA
jgi:predicted RNase H-like HicB family nuclease